MSDALHELRPRSAVELYDASLHLCVHTQSELPILALLGGVPLAVVGLFAVNEIQLGHPYALYLPVIVLLLVFRQMCQGAGALAALREIEGNPVSATEALGQSFRRLPSFVTATAWLVLFDWVAFVPSFGLSSLFLSVQGVGPTLIAEGSANGWNFGRIARERLRGRGGAAFAVRLIHGLVLLLLVLNLLSVVLVSLSLGRTLFDLDISYAQRFASPSHGYFDLCVLAVAQLLLEPVRCATQALLLADARVRHEGFDLRAALVRIRSTLPSARSAAALLVGLGLLWSRPARADAAPEPGWGHPPDPAKAASEKAASDKAAAKPADPTKPADPADAPADPVDKSKPVDAAEPAPDVADAPADGADEDLDVEPVVAPSPIVTGTVTLPEDPAKSLDALAAELGLGDDPEVKEGLTLAGSARDEERVQLAHLAAELDDRLDRGEEAGARDELKQAMRLAAHAHTAGAEEDPRKAVQGILAQPEFEPVHHRLAGEAEPEQTGPSWWDRFWVWLLEWLKKLLEERANHPVEPGEIKSGLDAGAAKLVTMVLVGLAAVIILIAVIQTARRAKPKAAGMLAGGSGDGDDEEVDALSRPAWVWSEDADKLAAEGRYREAIRSLYLALLATLHRRGVIDYHPALSNWDYTRAFKGEDGERGPFVELTRRFDFGWYGRLGADVAGYTAFKSLASPFLAGQPSDEAARA
jgi:hypothetical protein